MNTRNCLIWWCGVGLLIGLLGPVRTASASDEPALNSELPIRKVVLYKHGVGYFERAGSVAGGQEVNLYFKSEQMNDLLKSLTVIDREGGPVSSIVYDSTKTVEQLLGEYTFDLRGANGLGQILQQLN